MPSRPFFVTEGSLHIVPVCHQRMEFATAVRAVIRELSPVSVAVELPTGLKDLYARAVGRFPMLSVLANRSPDAEGEEPFTFYRVEPTDPLAEAIRTGMELGLAVHCIDLSVEHYPDIYEPMPDSYAVYRLGLEAYWEQYARGRNPNLATPLDEARERHMACHLRRLLAAGPVVFVCGMAHVEGVLAALREQRDAFGKHATTPALDLYAPDQETIRTLSGEMPLVMTLYELMRGGPGPEGAWVDLAPPEPKPEPEPEPPQAGLEGMTGADAVTALQKMLGIGTGKERPLELTPEQWRFVFRHLSAMPDPRLSIAGMQDTSEAPHLEGAPGPTRASLTTFKFKTCNDRRSQLQEIYHGLNAECRGADGWLDRQKVLHRACQVAGDFYQQNTGESFKRWQHRVLTQFARNYARLQGRLLPDVFQLTMAASGSVDHNYAYELWDLATFYPWAVAGDGARGIHIDPSGIEMDGVKCRRWTFHRKLPRLRQRADLIERRNESRPGEWEQEYDPGRLCSYPPEDVVIEDYGRYVQRKGVQVLSLERVRVEPFSTSLLDGIDMRTTLRNWADGQKLYVRESQRVRGGAGSVVIIFDDDKRDSRYPWRMTWHGEPDQQSDMAFYATPAEAKLVGPGIARCEYGGLMLSYPRGRLMDVWSNPLYRGAQTKAEVLLFAAIDYCLERHIVYVAEKPPRTAFRTLAARLGKKIVYLPIGQLSPVSIKRIRVFHVLSGHHLRQIAKDYIW